MYLVTFVLHDPDLLEELLDEWNKAGVEGATVLFSSGMGRMRQKPRLVSTTARFACGTPRRMHSAHTASAMAQRMICGPVISVAPRQLARAAQASRQSLAWGR